MRDVLVIANPAAGGGRTARALPELEARLREVRLDFDLVTTARGGDATALSRRAVAEGRRLVVAAGGDGTLNEVANGLLGASSQLPAPCLLGVVPMGTGGDFRRTLGVPLDPGAAARALAGGRTRLIDAGRVRCSHPPGAVVRYFVNVADAGIGGDVVAHVNRGRRQSRNPPTLFQKGLRQSGLGGFRLGHGGLTFLVASVVTLVRWRNKPMRIEIDGEALELVAQQVVIANCQYFGGGMRVAPQAVPDDGLLDVVVAGDLGRLESVRGLGRFRRGAHLAEPHPKISCRRARRVEISSPQLVRVDVDGEQPGLLPAVFEVVPEALRVVIP